MKLEYKVLCIDDKISRFKATEADFKEFNSDVGIDVKFDYMDVSIGARESLKEFSLRIKSKLKEKFPKEGIIYDVILVDLHFGPKDEDGKEVFNGSDVIEIIREKHNKYRPVVFYSSGEPKVHAKAISQLEESAKKSKIWGKSIFIKAFKDLKNFLREIAAEMHEEEHKINHVRGLLMDQVSELDANIINAMAIDKLWQAVPVGKQKKVVKVFKDRLKGQYKKVEAVYSETKNIDYAKVKEYILENPKEVETFTKAKVLRSMLDEIDVLKKQGGILSEGINPGAKCIINIRNKYGHQTAEVLVKEHTKEQCKLIREETRRQLKNIKEVINF